MTPAFASEPESNWSPGRSIFIERHSNLVLPWSTRAMDDQVLTYFFAPAVIDHQVEAGSTRRIDVHAGSTVVSMTGRTETVRSRGPIDVLAVSFPQAMLCRVARADRVDLEPSSGSLDPRLRHLMLVIEEERRLDFPTGDLFIDAACDALAALLLSSRALSPPMDRKLNKNRMQIVRDAIVERLDEPISLALLASLIGVSTTTLTREFKRNFGVSPYHFALEQRIERCKAMLRLSRNTITEVALATGFQTSQHMATVFKRFTGKTPSEFRAGHT